MIRADAIRVAATATAVPRAFSPRTSIRRLPRPNIKEKIGTTRRKRRNGELLTWLVAQGIFSSSIYAWDSISVDRRHQTLKFSLQALSLPTIRDDGSSTKRALNHHYNSVFGVLDGRRQLPGLLPEARLLLENCDSWVYVGSLSDCWRNIAIKLIDPVVSAIADFNSAAPQFEIGI
jgi:hypothetical protein